MKIIGIAGGSGTGKTTITNTIKGQMPETVEILSLDSYYKDNSHLTPDERMGLNFDHPAAFDFDLLYKHLLLLKKGRSIECPTYSYIERTRQKATKIIYPVKILLIEGLMLFIDERITNILDLKFYIDFDEKHRLKNIVNRDVMERGRDEKEVIERFQGEVNPMHNNFVEKQSKKADIVIKEINLEEINTTIMQHIKTTILC